MIGKCIIRASLALCIGLAMAWASPVKAASYCDSPPESKNVQVIADWLPWALHGPFMMAQDEWKGYYADEGIEVELILPATSADPLKLVGAGKVDIAMNYLPDVLVARESGVPVVSIATTLRPLPTGFHVLPESKIMGPKDLKGRTVGVAAFPSARAEMSQVLESVGLSEDDLKVVDPGYAGVELMLAGKLDADWTALITTNPYIVDPILEAEGRPPARFYLNRDYGVPNYYYQLLVANEEWAKQNPSTVCRFLRATGKGHAAFYKNPDAVMMQIFKDNDAFTLEANVGMNQGIWNDWIGSEGKLWVQDPAVWKTAQAWALKFGLISDSSIDSSAYFSNDYLPN